MGDRSTPRITLVVGASRLRIVPSTLECSSLRPPRHPSLLDDGFEQFARQVPHPMTSLMSQLMPTLPDISGPRAEDPLASVLDFLKLRAGLLVLDNCEHVAKSMLAQEQVGDMIRYRLHETFQAHALHKRRECGS